MSTVKPAKTPALTGRTAAKPAGTDKKHGVRAFAEFVPDSTHKRLDEMIDQTIYIVKIEPLSSDAYGEGMKIWFKDLPNARETCTAACFSSFVLPSLQNMYTLTHDGAQISLDSPIKATIRQAGKSYRLE